jgi:hypothetical protein
MMDSKETRMPDEQFRKLEEFYEQESSRRFNQVERADAIPDPLPIHFELGHDGAETVITLRQGGNEARFPTSTLAVVYDLTERFLREDSWAEAGCMLPFMNGALGPLMPGLILRAEMAIWTPEPTSRQLEAVLLHDRLELRVSQNGFDWRPKWILRNVFILTCAELSRLAKVAGFPPCDWQENIPSDAEVEQAMRIPESQVVSADDSPTTNEQHTAQPPIGDDNDA